MSFAVVLEPEAIDELASLLPDIAELVVDEIDRIAISPWLARSTSMPHPVPGLVSYAEKRLGSIIYSISISYQIGQDEESVHIISIAVDQVRG